MEYHFFADLLNKFHTTLPWVQALWLISLAVIGVAICWCIKEVSANFLGRKTRMEPPMDGTLSSPLADATIKTNQAINLAYSQLHDSNHVPSHEELILTEELEKTLRHNHATAQYILNHLRLRCQHLPKGE